MIRVFEKKGASGQLREAGLDDASSIGTVWIDAVSPTKEELHEISKRTRIPVSDFSGYINPKERPHIKETELYTRIVFSGPVEDKGAVKAVPMFIFLFGRQGILTIHKKETSLSDRISKHIQKNPEILNSSSSFLDYYLDTVVSEYFYFFDSINEQVDRIEETIFRNPAKISTHEIFRIKKIIILFHKALIADRDVVVGIEKGYIKKITEKERELFRDTYNDVAQLIDVEETYRDVLTGVLETYLTTLSNTLNDIMKRLAGYASLVLVPTLIAGIYGMNFRHMPELEWYIGYPFSIALMGLSALFTYYFFKRKGWV